MDQRNFLPGDMKKVPFGNDRELSQTLLPPGVDRHMRVALRDAWRAFRKDYRCCQRRASEAAVHRLRVETRRLLSLLNLLGGLVGKKIIQQVVRRLRKLLRRFARLRDTQVQLLAIRQRWPEFPGAELLCQDLQKREKRLLRRLRDRLEGTDLAWFRKEFKEVRKLAGRLLGRYQNANEHRAALIEVVGQSFGEVLALRRLCRATDSATIHNLRVAFKRFRYMVEWLESALPGDSGKPGVSRAYLRRLHAFQDRLGEIQDADVLLGTLDKFRRRWRRRMVDLSLLHQAVEQRRRELVRAFLEGNRDVERFWPPPPARGRRSVVRHSVVSN